jgi:hypothetical protein
VENYLHIGEGLEARLMYKKNGKTGEDNWKDMMVHDEDAEMMMVMWKEGWQGRNDEGNTEAIMTRQK